MIAPNAEHSVMYTQALSKGGSLLAETRILVQAWHPGEPNNAFAERVLREDLLGRATARRVLDIVRVFTLRFLTPSDAPARHLRRLVENNASRQIFNDVVYYSHELRNEPVEELIAG